MWKPEDPSEGSWALWMNNSCQRYLMRELWQKAEIEPTIFVCIDCEHRDTKICELGLTIQKKEEEPICRNIVVNTNFRNKEYPRPFGFGSSEHVTNSADLFPILYDVCNEVQKHKLVLVGFDVSNDLKYLDNDAGWRFPKETIVLDVQDICKTFLLKNKGVKLEDGLRKHNIQVDQGVPLHIGGNDSWYIMRLLFDMARRDSSPKEVSDVNFSSDAAPKKRRLSDHDVQQDSVEVSQANLDSLMGLFSVLNTSIGCWDGSQAREDQRVSRSGWFGRQ